MKTDKAAAQDIRGIAANTARDLALSLRLASMRMENFEPGQGKDSARELAEQLSVSARRAVELYYLPQNQRARISTIEGSPPPPKPTAALRCADAQRSHG